MTHPIPCSYLVLSNKLTCRYIENTIPPVKISEVFMNKKLVVVAVSGLAIIISGCGGSSTSTNTLDSDLGAIITAQGLTGDPTTGRNLPSINDPLPQLGMKLFFTKGLGADQDSACVSCHHPTLGGGDDLSLSIGVDAETADLLGPGRRHELGSPGYDGGPTVPRNAPTTYNIGMWDEVMFHDGRVESLDKTAGANGAGPSGIRTPDSAFGVADPNAGANLTEAQCRFPVTSPEEMRGFDFPSINSNDLIRTDLENRLKGVASTITPLATNDWLAEFRTGFTDPAGTANTLITYGNIARAIGEYERSQIFINNPWKAYVDGDKTAISDDAKKGAILFFSSIAEGGANCAACHRGDFFTDEQFHVVATPQVGRGKGDGVNGNDDFGRFRETAVAADKYAFRTPSLLNVEMTGPWNHVGSYTSLEAVVRHMLNPQSAIDNYDYTQIDAAIDASDMAANTQLAMDTLTANRTAGVISPILEDVTLTDTQVNQLVEFLKALTDPCLKDRTCIGQWVPTSQDSNPDALRINAFDQNGDAL
jgi:cytochrome c peroxidase